ncbi:MAG: uncharacterized membrane protein HdeD (DUF308 family) [Nonlabens sp.]|jgi:uncharacterized membrane protein HdeD (DUF308 family)
MKFLDEADNFRYVLWALTIIFAFLVFYGPNPEGGSLMPTAIILLSLFGSLLFIYLVLKIIQKVRYKDNESN